jgi:hypothetical protein
MLRRVMLVCCLLGSLCAAARAQQRVDPLSDAEVEKLRDVNRMPNDRVLAFVGFLDDRAARIHDLTVKPRKPGLEDDLHEQMEQFLSIADDLEDNLDEYETRHMDVRKALPKLLKAIDKWTDILKAPPGNESYNVARKLDLEGLRDLREDTERMVESQKAWFAAHPPPKDSEGRPAPG